MVAAVSTANTQSTLTELLDALGTNLSNISGRTVALLEVVFGSEQTPPLDDAVTAGLVGHLEAMIDAARKIDERLERLGKAL